MMNYKHISIHAPREGSDVKHKCPPDKHTLISIHAPREGSDVYYRNGEVNQYYISIHAPREGSDMGEIRIKGYNIKFQSTLPVRGATRKVDMGVETYTDFNPRSP